MDSQQNQAPDASASPLSGMLSALLANPALMEQVKQTVQSASAGATPPQEASAEGTGTEAAPPQPIVLPASGLPADGLATVLSNPELMAKLPQMMAMLRPMLEATRSDNGGNASLRQREKSSEEQRNELLCALKPFLSPERRNAVDAMLRISQLGTVIKHIK